jgi:hypothetical protein
MCIVLQKSNRKIKQKVHDGYRGGVLIRFATVYVTRYSQKGRHLTYWYPKTR